MTSQREQVRITMDRLHAAAAAIGRPVTFMEVCGTHTMSVFRSGLRDLLPPTVRLLSGPGCPVCVTSQGDIDQLIALALDHDVTVCTYGDMLRVPGRRGSLEQARSRGADVRVVYSAMDALRLAKADPARDVVFAGVGFETTAPATAVAVLAASAAGARNFSVLASHKRIIPAMSALLRSGELRLDGFLLPGHVSVIIGSAAYRELTEAHVIAGVVAGFEPCLLAAAILRLVELVRDERVALVNLYEQAVGSDGNRLACQKLEQVFEPSVAEWRGMGAIPHSGMRIRPAFRRHDARCRFDLAPMDGPEPRGCRCGEVIRGVLDPDACPLFARTCSPINPIGPCMVSSEGTCQAWFKYGRRPAEAGALAEALS